MTDLAQRLAELRRGFVAQARIEADAIERHAAAQAWDAVRDLCHRLAGRAGMLGFPEITDLARGLEEAVDGAVPPADLDRLARELVCSLRAAGD
jgi:HPt (histidine-containing phosphotransfer) domain-containing protein